MTLTNEGKWKPDDDHAMVMINGYGTNDDQGVCDVDCKEQSREAPKLQDKIPSARQSARYYMNYVQP